MSKRVGTVSYNINCNFTNYGSALQSWALSESIRKIGHTPVLIDYCPDILRDKNPLDPMRHMWDTDAEARRQCELSLPAIRGNYVKFENFYMEKFNRTAKKYYSETFNEVCTDEQLDAFVCGSDTIFCVDEFGIDDGYYAHYPCMKNGHTISYASSFGDSHFTEETYALLNDRLQNFKAIGIRESGMLPYVREHTTVRCEKVLDNKRYFYQLDGEGLRYEILAFVRAIQGQQRLDISAPITEAIAKQMEDFHSLKDCKVLSPEQ